MNLRYTFILTYSLFLISSSLLAQESTSPIVTWNSTLNSFDKELPFDREFYIKITKKKEQKLINFKVKGKHKPQRSTNREFTKLERERIDGTYDEYTPTQQGDQIDLPRNSTAISINDKGTEVYVLIFPLNPNSFYEFGYTLELDTKILDKDITKASKIINESTVIDSIPLAFANFTASLSSNLYLDRTIELDTLAKQIVQESPLIRSNSAVRDSIKNELEFIRNPDKSEGYESYSKVDVIENLKSITAISGIDTTKQDTLIAISYPELESKLDSINKIISFESCDNKVGNERAYCITRNYYENENIAAAISFLVEYDQQLDRARKPDERNKLKVRFEKLNSLITDVNQIGFSLDEFANCYDRMINYLVSCESCTNQSNQDLLNQSILPYLITSSLLSGDEETSNYIIQGLLPINYKSLDSIAKESEIEKRRQNIVLTIDFLENLFRLKWYHDFWQTCSDTQDLLKNLKKRKEKFDNLLSHRKTLSKDLVSYRFNLDIQEKGTGFKPFAEYIVEESGGTTGSDLTTKSKSKFTVRPDLGIGYASAGSFDKAVPFIGVRFNLRPIDPDIPSKSILYKNFWYRSSINISYTPISVSDNSTRFDLYGSNNLLLGYGYRLNNAFNLSTGVLIFRRKDPDLSPFENGKKAAFMPYVALTVDFDIITALKSIANAFGIKTP